MLRRYSVRLRIYSWFMKYLPPPWRLRASSLSFSGDVGRHQQCRKSAHVLGRAWTRRLCTHVPQWIRYPGILLGESYSGIRALVDFIRDVAKYQQAFWRHCRGTVAILSTNSVVLVSSFFFFFDSTSTPVTHRAAIPFTALFTQERVLWASTLCWPNSFY